MTHLPKDSGHQKRLKILEEEEIQKLFSRPLFNQEDQGKYFSLSYLEQKALDTFRSLPSKIIFILQLGYFKSQHLFFDVFFDEAHPDITYIVKRYFPDKSILSPFHLTEKIRSKQKKMILSLCGYKALCKKSRQSLETLAQDSARIGSQPLYIFRSITTYLAEEKIVFPAYSTLQSFVGRVLTYEQKRLKKILQKTLTFSHKKSLDSLLEDLNGLYKITQLKRDPRDFSLTEIKNEIERGSSLKSFYQEGVTLLENLKISPESIKYYSYLVSYYSIFRLNRFDEWKKYLYLMCFIHHRYHQHHDNLIQCLLFYVRRFSQEAKEIAKEKVYRYKLEKNEKLHKAGQVLQLFTEEDIPQDTLFCETQKKAFSILEKDQLALIAENMTADLHFDEKEFQWEALESLGLRYKLYLRPLLLAIPFIGEAPQSDFLQCLNFLKDSFLKGQSLRHFSDCKIPTSFLSKKDKKYLYKRGGDKEKKESKEKILIKDRYEFYCYRLLRNRLESGDIFCRESIRFRSFEEDLIDRETWKKNKNELIQRARLTLLEKPIETHLEELEKQLDLLLQDVNQRIEAGNNKYIKITQKKNKKSWTFVSSSENDSLKTPFFEALPQVSLISVLRFTQQNCRFIEAFDHVLERYVVYKMDENVLLACLIAWGTNTGLVVRMGQISDIDYRTLSQTSDHFIRLETLHKANQLICDKIAQTPIFEDHNLGGIYHSSSDGQKFETKHPTFNARHSPKYFGLKKGVVAYSFVLNSIPFWAKIIGAHEHESHYVFDLLHNNASDIVPKLHSTDTHGTNEVNFAILHVFGYQFAPRYRNMAHKMETGLYSFKKPLEEGFFKPVRPLKKQLIIGHWDWIQRIMVSLALKQTTQSLITSKLSSYARKNKVQKALWEYDNIFSSLYLLNYVDVPALRNNVQKALNRGENYNKLRKAVAFSHFGKLRFKTENEQQIWQECSRLITNCILYYNAVILSRIKEEKQKNEDFGGVEVLKRVSLAAWQHINLYGRYEFTKKEDPIDLIKIIHCLMKGKK